MDPKTVEFLALIVFSALAIFGGFYSRERGWLREETSRQVHWFTIVVLWSLAAVLSLWNLTPQTSNAWILILEPGLVAATAFVTIPIAKALGLKRDQVGVLAIAAGISNTGFALGSFLAYALLPTPTLLAVLGGVPEERALQALAYGVLTVTVMSTAVVILLFPVAQHFGSQSPGGQSLGRLIFKSFVDWKAMLFYASVAGVALAYSPIEMPRQINDWYILKVLFFLGAGGAYFGIGMRLHIDHLRPHFKSHALLFFIKFAITPLIVLGMLGLISISGLTGPPPLMAQTLLLLAFMPTAIQTVILSNLFNLDARMAGSVWLVNTVLFCVIVMPILLVVVPRL